MASERFSTTLELRLISLKTAADVAQFSFIVQKSISCLDLRLCQKSRFSNYFPTLCNCCISRHLRNFENLNSEEKCRNFFTPSRRLLYTLHLDLPTGRECSLMEDVPESVLCFCRSRSPHLGKIAPTCGFYTSILSNLIEEAIGIGTPKLKILKWLLNFPFHKVPMLARLESQTANKFIDCFYPKVMDPALVKDFIMQFDIIVWMTKYQEPEILEYLLYHARRLGKKDLEDEHLPIDIFVGTCVYHCSFKNIGPVLKYINVPRFTSCDYRNYLYEISCSSPTLTRKVLQDAEKWIKRERIHHMLQIIWIYMIGGQFRGIEAKSEALRLLWSSFPDAYISFNELKTVFENVFSYNQLQDIYLFYARAVGQFHTYVEPRSLQHLCRSTTRRILRENKKWIPEGISLTSLAKPLQLFLNLEKVCFKFQL